MHLAEATRFVNGSTHSFSTNVAVSKLGHNGGPEIDEATARRARMTLRTQWAKALFSDPDTPTYVMAMAWVIHWFSDKDGRGAAISNEQFESICNMSRPTVTKGKEWLRANGYVRLKVGDGRSVKTMFQMAIPQTTKGEVDLPLSDDATEDKGETTIRETPLPATAVPETTLPLSEKGETSLQKGETSLPPYSRDNLDNTTLQGASVPAKQAVWTATDAKRLCDRLLEEHHPFLDGQRDFGLSSFGLIASWLESGADPELDIVPTVRARCAWARSNNKSISGWQYFTKAIHDAKANRLAARNGSGPSHGGQSTGYVDSKDKRKAGHKTLMDAIKNMGDA